jgi:hypothetical protein
MEGGRGGALLAWLVEGRTYFEVIQTLNS